MLAGSVVAIAIIGLVAYRGISTRRNVAVSTALSTSNDVANTLNEESHSSAIRDEVVHTEERKLPTIQANPEPVTTETTDVVAMPISTQLAAMPLEADSTTIAPLQEVSTSLAEPEPAESISTPPQEFQTTSAETEPAPAIASPVPEAPPPFPEETIQTKLPTDVNAVSNIANPTESATSVLVIAAPKQRSQRASRKRLPSSTGTTTPRRRRSSPRKSVAPTQLGASVTVASPATSANAVSETGASAEQKE